MSKKQVVVLFQDGKLPRVYKNPFSIDDLKKHGEVIINPRIPKKAPPHTWELKDGKIIVNKGKKAAELPKYHITKKEKTGFQLEQDIEDLANSCAVSAQNIKEEVKKAEKDLIDNYRRLCNISILGFFILLFLILNLDTIKQIFGKL
jgi:hypothetical protein